MKINFNLKKHNFSQRWEKEAESNAKMDSVSILK